MTKHGRQLASLPLHPRLAHMVVTAHDLDRSLRRFHRPGSSDSSSSSNSGGGARVGNGQAKLGPLAEEACWLAALLQEGHIPRGQ